jgi:hypothetical protein
MVFPANGKEMERMGYLFLSHGKCDACEMPIEWWQTPLKHGRRTQIPMDPMLTEKDAAVTHWKSCTERKREKKAVSY